MYEKILVLCIFLCPSWSKSTERVNHLNLSALDITNQSLAASSKKVPSNLAQYLAELKSSKSLTVLTNFQHADLTDLGLPIVLRNPQAVKSSSRYFWVSKIRPCNGTCGIYDIICPVSKHVDLNRSGYIDNRVEHCFSLNFFSFSSSAKPWKFLLQIGLSLPNGVLKTGLANSRVFRFERVDKNYFNLFPFSPPSINVLISYTTYSPESLNNWIFCMTSLVYCNIDIWQPTLSSDRFIFLEAEANLNLITKAMFVTHQERPVLVRIASFDFNSWTLFGKERYSDAFSKIAWDGSWLNPLRHERIHRAVSSWFRNCEALSIRYKHLRLNAWKENYEKRFSLSLALLAFALFGNETYKQASSLNCYCQSGQTHVSLDDQFGFNYKQIKKDLRWKTFSNKKLYYQNRITVENLLGTLKFVTCGQRGTKAFLFAEFINIYDTAVWVCVLFSLLLIMILVPYWNGKNLNKIGLRCRPTAILPFLKVILEQGDSFICAYGQPSSLRLLFAGFLLSGLVLSNAYKNTNVYNIITSRKPVLYETLNQLVEGGYAIYSRTSLANFEFLGTPGSQLSNYLPIVLNKHYIAPINVDVLFRRHRFNERKALSNNWFFGFTEVHYVKFFQRETRLRKLHQSSTYHNSSRNLLTSLIRTVLPLMKIGLIRPQSKGFNDFIADIFLSKELEQYGALLERCNKTAIILSEYLCHNYAKKAAKKHKALVSVGKEIFTNISIEFSLEGLIDPYFIRRSVYLKESGVVDRLTQVTISSRLFNSNENLPPKAASLKGNALMIFILLFGGQAVAIILLAYLIPFYYQVCRKKLSVLDIRNMLNKCGIQSCWLTYLIRVCWCEEPKLIFKVRDRKSKQIIGVGNGE